MESFLFSFSIAGPRQDKIRKTVCGIYFLCSFGVLFFLPPAPCQASFLSLSGESRLEFTVADDFVTAKGSYIMSNQGDEAARNVYPAITIGGWKWSGQARDLAARTDHSWQVDESFPLSRLSCQESRNCSGLELPLKGVFPVYITRHYQDLNGYQFSAAEIASLQIGLLSDEELSSLDNAGIAAAFECRGNGRDFHCTLFLKNISSVEKEIAADFFTSNEILALTKPFLIKLAPEEASDFSIDFKNISGLPGSSYAVHSILQWQDMGLRKIQSASQTFSISRRSRVQIYLVVGILVFSVLAVCLSVVTAGSPRRKSALRLSE